ncbi:hypothetical protein ACRTAL_000002 [Clostridium perfringens]|uniref:Uncharacterized protein n=3 Tax=Clostridium perfringens TaxID=1502 RepID=A0A0H2YU67_CLOP1|nr:hypothetical protein [Clostridium perfringens]STB11399.1 Uncharacterised protein [Clostridium novyi]ABG84104.1 conserved hypothetical protein [Clostridium perfringens ATCC 13124]MDM0811945.1 hypothetical protein [Clostridium perfringens]MDM0884972.1 hypothetical protein [Clostridium perfringens]MDU1016194.1 hypothetical protein [Clostridium perfringens]
MKLKLIENKILRDSPNSLKQKVINEVVKKGIATYKYKTEPDLIQLYKKTIEEKISECLEKDQSTIKIIDLIEMKKGYKHSILYDYKNLDTNLAKKKCIDIETEYYKNVGITLSELETLCYETENEFFIKFHNEIDILEKVDLPKWFKVRYPILFVFHKKFNILEVKFDKISTDKERKYYKIAISKCFKWLEENLKCKCSYLNLDKYIRNLLEDPNGIVKEIVWTGELAKSQGITLKAGEDMSMPFFQQLEKEIISWKEKYAHKEDALDCLKDIEDYLNKTKKFANDKLRTLRFVKYKENNILKTLEKYIELKITYNYSGTSADLIDVIESEVNDLERMNYVIELIGTRKINKPMEESIAKSS